MKNKMLLKKICSVYANELHFATLIFPFIHREIEKDATIRTILEENEQENIEKVLENTGLNSEIKEEIRKIDWKGTNINKIRENFKLLESDIKNKKSIDIVISGKNVFIQKVNKVIDLWVKNNIELLEENDAQLNIVNCFSFDENKKIEKIINTHEYILKTTGLEELVGREELLKAN